VRVEAKWTPAALRRALNAVLPDDVWVASAHTMRPGFHARVGASRAGHRDRASAQSCERRLQLALHRASVALPLPPGEARAVVVQHELHGARRLH
jgi:tRNA pseudouridine38-40 synthase